MVNIFENFIDREKYIRELEKKGVVVPEGSSTLAINGVRKLFLVCLKVNSKNLLIKQQNISGGMLQLLQILKN